jgi:hypothetical protein
MERRHSCALVILGLLAVSTAVGDSPAKLSPVLPEVTKQLADGEADVQTSTFSLARAHARLVLLDKEVIYSVTFDGVPDKQKKGCLSCLQSAIQEWERDLNGTIQFTQCRPKDTANVVIHFKPVVTMQKEQVAGYVNWSRKLKTDEDGSVSADFKADLQLRVNDLEGKRMPAVAMRHAAMHELGHVLGLDDSPNEGDVMGPLDVENPVSAPTPLEIETVRSLRAEASQILDKAAAESKN